MPGVVELKLHVRLDVPPEDSARMVGLQVVTSPVDGDAEDERVTVPAKLFRLVTWNVDAAVEPVLKLTEELPAEIEKSGTEGGGGGGALLSFHAVKGCISQPLNWCQVALRFPGSQ